ncbi:MAG: quinone-dependent dihydroorotate dehydrogenase [Verrucomicrobia bacterium]|nr:quinone-dependent dihydroorotate dehydrogenase [Verrucomicrobiota bacterium]
MIYERLLRPLLFSLDAERAHELALHLLRVFGRFSPRKSWRTTPLEQFGLQFPHRIGLAAGLDKNGVALPAWEALGFAFAEIGTVTARAQPGNPPPRIFRYPAQRALINRLGFNNDGATVVAQRLAHLRERSRWPRIPVGINIGKSRDTPLEAAAEDYVFSLGKLRPFADYIALNVSSPNTPGLRELQDAGHLDSLLRVLASERAETPLLVKIAPDLELTALDELIGVCEANKIAGIIATNTTLDHSAIPRAADEQGGLSGAPLREKSTAILRHIASRTRLPVIGCGGIFDKNSAREKLQAGASLLHVYTGFIYRGPQLVRELSRL